MADMGDFGFEYNETSHEAVVHMDKDPDAPSQKYGFWLEFVVFAMLIPVAIALVSLVFFLSRRHEIHKRKKREAEKQHKFDNLKDQIPCKPWCHPDDQSKQFSLLHLAKGTGVPPTKLSREVSAATATTMATDESSDVESARPSAATTIASRDSHFPDPPVGRSFKQWHNGFYCAICTEAFAPGQPVYTSNNVQCGHQIHMLCMDKWMEYQNTCPVCQQPFVVVRVHEGDFVDSTTRPPAVIGTNNNNSGNLNQTTNHTAISHLDSSGLSKLEEGDFEEEEEEETAPPPLATSDTNNKNQLASSTNSC